MQCLETFRLSTSPLHRHCYRIAREAQPPPPGGWTAGSTSPSSPQGLETRSRKHARTHSASLPPADSNCTLGAVVDAQRDISRVTTDSYQGNTASAYRTWLQSINQQTTGKPAYTLYIGAKVAQHFETGWAGIICPVRFQCNQLCTLEAHSQPGRVSHLCLGEHGSASAQCPWLRSMLVGLSVGGVVGAPCTRHGSTGRVGEVDRTRERWGQTLAARWVLKRDAACCTVHCFLL